MKPTQKSLFESFKIRDQQQQEKEKELVKTLNRACDAANAAWELMTYAQQKDLVDIQKENTAQELANHEIPAKRETPEIAELKSKFSKGIKTSQIIHFERFYFGHLLFLAAQWERTGINPTNGNKDHRKAMEEAEREPTPTDEMKATIPRTKSKTELVDEYEAKQEAKRERYEARAAKAKSEASAARNAAKERADQIPFGQPILVGHHSERRARRDAERIRNDYQKSFDLTEKAKHYERKAERVGKGGISSDDPRAIDKLKRQIEVAEAHQEAMKKANRIIRKKNQSRLQKIAEMMDKLNISQEMVVELVDRKDCFGNLGYASYELRNNNAEIRRLKNRVEELESIDERESVEIETDTYTYVEDLDENRIMVYFESKPPAETRATLKRYAFKWSRSREAWTRKITANALAAAKHMREELDR